MQAHSRLKSEQSKRFVEKRQKTIWKMIVLSLLTIIIVLFATSEFCALDSLTIKYVDVVGADQQISSTIRSIAMSKLSGDYLALFSRANVLLYPRSEIEQTILKNLPRVASVNVQRKDLQSISVNVIFKDPAAVICPTLPDLNSNPQNSDDQCYFSDETGYIYAPAPSFSNTVYDRFYEPNLDSSSASTSGIIGSYATSTDEFARLRKFLKTLRNENINTLAVLSKDAGEYELYIANPGQNHTASSTDQNTAVVYFNDDRSFDVQAANFISFWKKMLDQAKLDNKQVNFDSIDIRYGSNVFYRLAK